MGGRHRGSLIALGVLGVLLLGAFAGYMGWANQQLGGGLLKQEREARRRPDWVPVSQLPAYARSAFITVLDTTSALRRPRYDTKGGRAHMSRDLVKQVYGLRGGVQDGVREAAMAQLLEVRSSDSRRMELYLNRVAMGRTESWAVYGIQHASQEYFGKDVRQVTLGEAATLAGILLEPRINDPEAVPGAVGARRNEVLRLMYGARRINESQLAAALAEPLSFQPGEDYVPMTRPLNREAQPEVIRLPEALRPKLNPDSASSSNPAR